MIKVEFLTFHWRKFVTCAFSGKGLLAQVCNLCLAGKRSLQKSGSAVSFRHCEDEDKAPIKRGRVKLAWTMPSVRRFDKVNLAPCAFNNNSNTLIFQYFL